MNKPRTTQRDIAKKAGVHVATVSMALRNHPRIPDGTKNRILKIAKDLGYTPDPMLSALAIYRDSRRPQTFHGTLGWLFDSSQNFDWRKSDHYTRYFQGAKKRAAENGFQLESFDVNTCAGIHQRLRTTFRARNITGLLICPHPGGYAGIDFPWAEFSLMTFGYSVTTPVLHAVASAHYRNTRRAMRELFTRGYRRPGLILGCDKGLTMDGSIYAAYMLEQKLQIDGILVPPFFDLEKDPSAFLRWIQKYKIDVILTTHYLVPLIKRTGFNLPNDIGFLNLSLPDKDRIISGILENDDKIGAVAADLLIAMIHRGERGIPSQPMQTHLDGSWNEGVTLPTVA